MNTYKLTPIISQLNLFNLKYKKIQLNNQLNQKFRKKLKNNKDYLNSS